MLYCLWGQRRNSMNWSLKTSLCDKARNSSWKGRKDFTYWEVCRNQMSQGWGCVHAITATAKSLQSCPTLCNAIPGILQARTLEWVAISFSNAWKWKLKVKSLSHVQLLATPWTAAYQAPLSMGFSRQEYWSGVSLSMPLGGFKRWG